MTVFILRRFLTLIATLAGASLIIFLVLDALPGNAAEMLMGADSSPEAIRAMTIKLGLDQPAGRSLSALDRRASDRRYGQ